MDVLAQKQNIDLLQLNDFVKEYKFKNSKIVVKGTASLKMQRYFSDYDLYSLISKKYKYKTIADEFNRIVSISKDDVYFIENKIQYMNSTKLRNVEIFKSSMFKNKVDFVKFDYVVRIDNIFKELSIIYDFNTSKHLSKNEMKEKLNDDIKDFIKDGSYFKVLKRLFSIYKIEKNKKKLVRLTRFFNSDYGKLYSINSNLKAIMLVLDSYDDKITKRKIEINLKDIHMDPEANIKQMTKYNDEILNKRAKIIYDGLI